MMRCAGGPSAIWFRPLTDEERRNPCIAPRLSTHAALEGGGRHTFKTPSSSSYHVFVLVQVEGRYQEDAPVEEGAVAVSPPLPLGFLAIANPDGAASTSRYESSGNPVASSLVALYIAGSGGGEV